jgi:hypothetical protein
VGLPVRIEAWDGVWAVTPLEPRRLSWWDLNFRTLRIAGVRRRRGRPLSYSEFRRSGCDLYVTYRSLGKEVGATGFEPATPAPKCRILQLVAALCNKRSSKSLIYKWICRSDPPS